MLCLTNKPTFSDFQLLKYLAKSIDLSKSDNIGKIQVEKTITREGTTFIEKYWKNPDEGIAKDERVIGGYHNLPKNHPEHPSNRVYKEFQSTGASNLYFGNNPKITLKSFGKWASSITENMKTAVNMYTHGLDRLANGLLRRTDKSYPPDITRKLNTTIDVLEKALDQFELKDDIIVHRKASASMLADFVKSPNGVWQDDGFTSTSTVKGSFSGKIEGGVLDITIKVPKGKGRGAWVSPMSHFPNENEFLLNRGTLFKIESIKGNHIEMSVVGRDPKELDLKKSISDNDFGDIQPNPAKFLWDTGELSQFREN